MSIEATLEESVRAGGRVLAIFENPLNVRILRAHAEGWQRFSDLQDKAWSPESTLRAAVAGLCEIGALQKLPVRRSPYSVATFLTPAGEEILAVADLIEVWLQRCPDGPIPPEGQEARIALKALAGGWSSALMRELAAGPFTLTELDRLIPEISYPGLERRLSWMRRTGQIEPVEREGRGTPFVVTDWLRYAIGPVCLAGRCERRHLADSAPITAVEVEAALLLSLPLAPLSPAAEGSCTLGVQLEPAPGRCEEPDLAGVSVTMEQGRITHATPDISTSPALWAVGTSEDWLDAVIDGRLESLRLGGEDPQLPADLVNGVHFALFGDR